MPTGAVPTTSEWSTSLLLFKVLCSEVWRYKHREKEFCLVLEKICKATCFWCFVSYKTHRQSPLNRITWDRGAISHIRKSGSLMRIAEWVMHIVSQQPSYFNQLVTFVCSTIQNFTQKLLSHQWCHYGHSGHSSSQDLDNPPIAAYMPQWIGSALVPITACRLFVAKPLSKLILDYSQLHP